MPAERKTSILIILLIFAFFLGMSLRINFPEVQQNFLIADEAVYYSMAQSLSHDFDIRYEKRDLIRYYEDIDSGPMGIFLKKGRGGDLYFAKSFLLDPIGLPQFGVGLCRVLSLLF